MMPCIAPPPPPPPPSSALRSIWVSIFVCSQCRVEVHGGGLCLGCHGDLAAEEIANLLFCYLKTYPPIFQLA